MQVLYKWIYGFLCDNLINIYVMMPHMNNEWNGKKREKKYKPGHPQIIYQNIYQVTESILFKS